MLLACGDWGMCAEQGCICFCLFGGGPQPVIWPKIWPNNRLGGKKLLKGDKKRGKMHRHADGHAIVLCYVHNVHMHNNQCNCCSKQRLVLVVLLLCDVVGDAVVGDVGVATASLQ